MATRLDLGEPQLLIDGSLTDSQSGETFAVTNPATGDELASVPQATEADVKRAISAAETAFEDWSTDFSADERADRLFQLADLIRDNAERLAKIEAANTGHTITAMRNDPHFAADRLEYFAGIALEAKGDTLPVSSDTLNYTLEQPYGVVGHINAFNHPLLFAAGKAAAPLVTGNTLVIKPASVDPLAVLELARLAAEEDILPDGVLNVVTGPGSTVGTPLIEADAVRKIGFVGGNETGSYIHQKAAETTTDVLMELGGKNPCIVYPDADLETAIEGAVTGMNFTYVCGQSCGSTSRLFLHESQYEEGLSLLEEAVDAIVVGDPMDPETEMGSLSSQNQHDTVKKYIDLGKESDARLLYGGDRPSGPTFEDGLFVEPTVFADVTMDMRIAREEIFGPVLSVFEWSDEDEVIEAANDVEYGLTASVFTDDLETAHRAARNLETGYVWINQSSRHYTGAPFGGWKQSGIGREESREELYEYTQTKNVNVKL